MQQGGGIFIILNLKYFRKLCGYPSFRHPGILDMTNAFKQIDNSFGSLNAVHYFAFLVFSYFSLKLQFSKVIVCNQILQERTFSGFIWLIRNYDTA